MSARTPGQDSLPPETPELAFASLQVSERQRQIYIEAARLFVAKGFHGASMSDLAEAVGLTKAGLYHFVSSKEELLFTIMSYSMDRLYLDVVDPAGEIEDPLARLKAIIRRHTHNVARVTLENGNPLSILVDEPTGLTPEHRKFIDGRKRGYFDLLRGTLDALKADGRLDKGADTTVVAHTIVGMIMWIARWRRPGGRTLDEIADQILHMTLSGALKPGVLAP